MHCITQRFLDRFDAVIVFLFDDHPSNFKLKLNHEHRLHCHDGFSDPLNWNADKCSNYSQSLSTPFYLKKALGQVIARNECLKDEPGKLGIIINSLSSLITHQDISLVCQDLFEVIQWRTQAFEAIQTVALVHCDLHEDKIVLSLNYMASTTIELQPMTKNIKDVGYFNIIHSKRTGKIHRQKEGYKIEDDSQLKIIQVKEDNEQTHLLQSENHDVASALTFNLSLTEEQKKARSNLQLPYLLDEKIKRTQLDLGKKSQIFYQADEADDLDEEDPDDDLNI